MTQTNPVLDVSAQFIHPGVVGASGTGSVTYDDALTVNCVETEAATAILLEQGGVITFEQPLVLLAAPAITFPNLTAPVTSINIGPDTAPLLVQLSVDPATPVGTQWVLNLGPFGWREGNLTASDIATGYIQAEFWIEGITQAPVSTPTGPQPLPAPVITFPSADGTDPSTQNSTISGTAYRTLTPVKLTIPTGTVVGDTWATASGDATSTGIIAPADLTAGYVVTNMLLPLGTTATVTGYFTHAALQGTTGSAIVEVVLLGLSGAGATPTVYLPAVTGFSDVTPQPVVSWIVTVNGIAHPIYGNVGALAAAISNITGLTAIPNAIVPKDLAIGNTSNTEIRLEISESTKPGVFTSDYRNPTFSQVQQGFRVVLAAGVTNSFGISDSSIYQYSLPGLTGYVSIGQVATALAGWLATPNSGWNGQTMVFDHVAPFEPYTTIVFRNTTMPNNPAVFNIAHQVNPVV